MEFLKKNGVPVWGGMLLLEAWKNLFFFIPTILLKPPEWCAIKSYWLNVAGHVALFPVPFIVTRWAQGPHIGDFQGKMWVGFSG